MFLALLILVSSAIIWFLLDGVGAWVAGGVFVFMAAAVVNGYFQARTPALHEARRKLIGNGRYGWEVVGESNYQDALEQIAGPKTEDGAEHYCDAVIFHQVDNEHDENACAVLIDSKTVGYLPRANAQKLVNLAAAAGRGSGFAYTAQAVIRGGWARDSDAGLFGVSLDVAASKLKDCV